MYLLIVVKDRPYGRGWQDSKGLPDDEGEAEIGYGIDPAYRSQGYMKVERGIQSRSGESSITKQKRRWIGEWIKRYR